jgi:hypothetical protein
VKHENLSNTMGKEQGTDLQINRAGGQRF